jgi:hypothetical protein
MPEIWAAMCPDCGPDNYEMIVADVVTKAAAIRLTREIDVVFDGPPGLTPRQICGGRGVRAVRKRWRVDREVRWILGSQARDSRDPVTAIATPIANKKRNSC